MRHATIDTNSTPYMVAHTTIAGMYVGASLDWKTCAPIQLPAQYATSRRVLVTLFFVRPATLDGSNVHMTACMLSIHLLCIQIWGPWEAYVGWQCYRG